MESEKILKQFKTVQTKYEDAEKKRGESLEALRKSKEESAANKSILEQRLSVQSDQLKKLQDGERSKSKEMEKIVKEIAESKKKEKELLEAK